MSAAPPRITCLFFSDVTVPAFLNSVAGRPFAGDLLVECGRHPALGFALNLETPANYPGVAGLLGGTDVGSLAHPTELLPAPILLAAGAPVAVAAVRAALALLRRPDERLTAVTLLVPCADARALGAALAVADRFLIAWDVAAFPHEELADFGRWLATEGLLTPGNFGGLFPYATGAVDPAHQRRLAALLNPLTANLPAIRSDVVNVG